jgi:hypothetical protein
VHEHVVSAAGKTHSVALPSQNPAQTLWPPQAARWPCGVCFEGIGQHVPAWPETLQAWHWPVQGRSQQAPSTHRPLWQSPSLAQAVPLGRLAVHAEPWQWGMGARQSASLRHAVRHAVPGSLQPRPSPHVLVAGRGQAPAPSHAAAEVSVLPAQDCERQLVALPGKVHVVREAAAHDPAQAPLPPQARRAPCGGPEVTAVQWPGAAVVSHASQRPEQAPSQQTPSTQRVDAHSPLPAQGDPSGLGPQEPVVQKLPGTH